MGIKQKQNIKIIRDTNWHHVLRRLEKRSEESGGRPSSAEVEGAGDRTQPWLADLFSMALVDSTSISKSTSIFSFFLLRPDGFGGLPETFLEVLLFKVAEDSGESAALSRLPRPRILVICRMLSAGCDKLLAPPMFLSLSGFWSERRSSLSSSVSALLITSRDGDVRSFLICALIVANCTRLGVEPRRCTARVREDAMGYLSMARKTRSRDERRLSNRARTWRCIGKTPGANERIHKTEDSVRFEIESLVWSVWQLSRKWTAVAGEGGEEYFPVNRPPMYPSLFENEQLSEKIERSRRQKRPWQTIKRNQLIRRFTLTRRIRFDNLTT